MKNWMKKIGENRFQFIFFLAIITLLFVALLVSATVPNDVEVPPVVEPPIVNPDDNVTTIPEETIKLPFDENANFAVVRKFYNRNATESEQEMGLIKYGNTYRISLGTSYAMSDNQSFAVLAALSGEVVEIKDSPLYGNYVILKHADDVKTAYYGLSEVTVNVGDNVAQGDKIGVSGITEIDAAAGNHVYFQVIVASKQCDPETAIGKKTKDL